MQQTENLIIVTYDISDVVRLLSGTVQVCVHISIHDYNLDRLGAQL